MTLDLAVAEVVSTATRQDPVTFTEVPADLVPPATEQGDQLVLIYSTDGINESLGVNTAAPEMIGAVVTARPSSNFSELYYYRDRTTDPTGAFAPRRYFRGVRLNPLPINGHYYRAGHLERTANPRLFLVQYNSSNVDRPWSIIRGDGNTPWVYENDTLSRTPDVWFEVLVEGQATSGAPAVEGEATGAEPAPVDYSRWNEAIRAELVLLEDGHPVLVEPGQFEDGQEYVSISPTRSRTAFRGIKVMGTDTPVILGEYSFRYGYWDSAMRTSSIPADVTWAKGTPPTQATTKVLSPDREKREVDKINAVTIGLREKHHALNLALNDLANKQGWCGEYDRIMKKFNMTGRDAVYRGTITDVRLSMTIRASETTREHFDSLTSALKVPPIKTMNAVLEVGDVEVEVEARSKDYVRDYLSTENIRNGVLRKFEREGITGVSFDDGYIENYNTQGVEWVAVNEGMDHSDLPFLADPHNPAPAPVNPTDPVALAA